MTRLLYVHNIRMPGPEANTVNVAKMCEAFAANGCDVTLATLPGCARSELKQRIFGHYGLKHDFELTALPGFCARPTLAAAVSAWISTSRRPDILYTRAPHIAWLSCRKGLPTIIEIHADLGAFSPLGARLLRETLRSSALLGAVVISEALRERLRNALGAAAPDFVVAHGGADLSEHSAPSGRTPRDRLAVGFVGRFYRGRGLELIASLCAACPWAEFHLAGGDEQELAAFIDPLPQNMIVHGSLPHGEVFSLMQRCDVLIAPYQRAVYVADGRTDTASWMSPLKVFEYMAAARPIVASNLPAIREVLTHDETALLCDPDNPGAWIAALKILRSSATKRRGLGKKAAAALRERYTWRARARLILDACPNRPRHLPAARDLQRT